MNTATKRRHILTVVAATAVGFAALDAAEAGTPGAAATPCRIVAEHRLGGDGGWDLLTVDAGAHRLYIARSDRVMIVDTEAGTLLGQIPGNGVHGVAIDAASGRGFITNGKDDTVTIFDRATDAVIGTRPTGTKPDAIALDPATGRIFVCDNGGTDLTVLDPATGAVVGHVEVGGAPELVAIDGEGLLYTNLEDHDEVAVVDTRAMKLTAHWPLAPGKGPSGVAIDRAHRRLFSACHDSRTLEVLDADTGRIVASLPIGARCDGAVFDAASATVFVPNGDGTLSIVHEDDPDHFTTTTLPTRAGARTIALDEVTHRLFTVTADVEPAKPGDPPPAPHARPRYLPDTFAVLIVGR